MKNVLLSADGEISVYSVPDEIADNFRKYCMDFCTDWLCNSPDAKEYREIVDGEVCLCYDAEDFIYYLNRYICDGKAAKTEVLNGVYDIRKVPKQYKDLPYFCF